jgi:hypothetical protein
MTTNTVLGKDISGLKWDDLANDVYQDKLKRYAADPDNYSMYVGPSHSSILGADANGFVDVNGSNFDESAGANGIQNIWFKDPINGPENGHLTGLYKNPDGGVGVGYSVDDGNFWGDVLKNAAMMGAIMYGGGTLMGELGGGAAGAAGAAEASALPAGGMTATGTLGAAPWEAVAADGLGSGLTGTGVSDIGALMGTTGGAFDLGTGLSGVTAADLSSALAGGAPSFPADALRKVASKLIGGSTGGAQGAGRTSSSGFSGMPNEIYNMNPGMIQLAAAPQEKYQDSKPFAIGDYQQPDFGYGSDSKLAKLAKALQGG